MNVPGIQPDDELRLKMLRALTDPLRLRLYYFLYDTHTAKEAAEALGLKKTSLYYHLRLLQEANLVVIVGEEKVRNLTLKYYASVKDVAFDRHRMANPGSKAPFFELIKGMAFTTYIDCFRELTNSLDKMAFGTRFFVKIKKGSLRRIPREIARLTKEFEKKLKSLEEPDGDVKYSISMLEFEMSGSDSNSRKKPLKKND